MVSIINKEMPKEQYSIKCPYEMSPTRIVIHNTANDASAQNEVAYMQRNGNKVSFHYAVDDKEIVQGIPLTRNSWNAGDGGTGKGNREGISIEICYSKSGGSRFEKAQDNAAELTAYLLKKYGWGIDKVTKHQDYNGKHCPHRTLDEYGWDYFLNLVKKYLNVKETAVKVKAGDLVIITGSKYYDGKAIPSWVKALKWVVYSVSGDKVVINHDENKKYAIMSPIKASDVEIVKASTTTAKPTVKTYKKGEAVKLSNAPLYASATDKTVKSKKSGTYYIYDGVEQNGRYRITISKSFCGRKPIRLFVTGWVKKTDIK